MFVSRLVGNIYNISHDEIIDLYKSVGFPGIGRELDGDFHLEIVDDNKRIIVSDFAGSKSDGLVEANTTTMVSMDDGKIINRIHNHHTVGYHYQRSEIQRRDNYDLFFEAIDNAVKKRLPKDQAVIALSGGYDSGTICASALSQDANFRVVSIVGNESEIVLEKRYLLLEHNDIDLMVIPKQDEESYNELEKEYLKKNYNFIKFHEVASHYLLSKHCSNQVLLSGLGADELYVNRDQQLLNMFIRSSNHVYKMYNIDARYPLLDPQVYMAYWSLTRDLVRRYKQPFEKYLTKQNFPLPSKDKVGFWIFDNY